MDIENIISNVPNQIFDDDYALTNFTCFSVAKVEYSLVKYLRSKMLIGEIQDQADLEENIKIEIESFDGGELMGLQFMLNQVIQILALRLNDFDKDGNNNFNGYIELEQYHTIASLIVKMLPELIINKITK